VGAVLTGSMVKQIQWLSVQFIVTRSSVTDYVVTMAVLRVMSLIIVTIVTTLRFGKRSARSKIRRSGIIRV
jgi:hypothetical protein